MYGNTQLNEESNFLQQAPLELAPDTPAPTVVVVEKKPFFLLRFISWLFSTTGHLLMLAFMGAIVVGGFTLVALLIRPDLVEPFRELMNLCISEVVTQLSKVDSPYLDKAYLVSLLGDFR